jgi:polyisoprenoid-binding protein YceI
MKKIGLNVLAIMLLAGFQASSQTHWKIDQSHSDIGFTVTHMAISEVDGNFTEFDAKVRNGTEDFNGSTVEFSAKVSSINTNNERRDGHLKSPDFFDAESYPEIKLTGKIEKEGDKYFLVGDFSMKDITKRVKFDVQYNGKIDTGRGMKAGFKVTGMVDRFDYGLKWNRTIETGGLVVGREVKITCNVQLDEANQ